MTAKEQVLKVYSKALCKAWYDGDFIAYYVVWVKGDILSIGGSPKSAWQSAANKLKSKEHEIQKD